MAQIIYPFSDFLMFKSFQTFAFINNTAMSVNVYISFKICVT